MKSIRLLPLVLLLLSAQVFAQSAGAGASAQTREDSSKTRRTQRELERELRRSHRSVSALEMEAQALEERARDMAGAAVAGFEALDEEELEARAHLAAELAGEAIAGVDWDGLSARMEHLGEAFEHMDFPGMAGLESLGALEGLSALAEIPPFPALAPMPPIPPIGPIPPLAPVLAGGVWRDSWSGPAQRYQQYLSEGEQTRLNALQSLLHNDEKLALPEVKILMQEKNWAMRASALEMLAQVEQREAVTILRDALQNETDKRVKRAAIRALSQREEPEAREALRALLQK